MAYKVIPTDIKVGDVNYEEEIVWLSRLRVKEK